MASTSKTFRLSQQTIRALEDLVSAGRAPSQTALVEALVAREKARLDLEREELALDKAWETAMRCPDYRAELLAVEAAFEHTDAESVRGIG